MRLTAVLRLPLFPLCLCASGSFVVMAACAHDPRGEPRAMQAEVAPVAPPAATDQGRVPRQPPSEDVRAELEAAQRKNVSSVVAHADFGDEGDGGANPNAAHAGDSSASVGADGGAAVSDVDLERRAFEVRARERLARIDARLKSVEEKRGKLTATKRTSFDTDLRRFTSNRADAEKRIGALARSGAGWKTAKGTVERSLDDLESMLSKLDDRF